MESYFETKHLAVGYDKKILIPDINIQLEKGKILTLIGPNGAGKSTILKTITRQLMKLGGTVCIGGDEVYSWSRREMARRLAVVLTDRVRLEMMTCGEVAAMGRYPYTNAIGKLTEKDHIAVREALSRVHALELENQDFSTLSDGQRQRILLARAICQEPEVIVLDEPTAYLDIRHKIELLDILREMAHIHNITVILSLHEIDLAAKLSDLLICVKENRIAGFGTPEELLAGSSVNLLYDIESGGYNPLLGSIELKRPAGELSAFVVGGGGFGIPCYRAMQKWQVPFAAGILFENDVDYQVAKYLSNCVLSVPAFELMEEKDYCKAADILCRCRCVIDAGTPAGTLNRMNGRLLELAERKGIPVYRGWKAWVAANFG